MDQGDAPRPWFDAYLVADWSVAMAPGCWWALATRERAGPVHGPMGRGAARAAIAGQLARLTGTGARVLLAVDAPFGYPAGFAARLGLEGPAWRAIWDLLAAAVHDDPAGRTNRFAVAGQLNRLASGGPFPFWGRPASEATPWLGAKRPRDGWEALAEHREVERAWPHGPPRPTSPWKLAYRGSVGSDALLAIPALVAWRDDPRWSARAWPFEPAAGPPAAGEVWLAEAFPTHAGSAGPGLARLAAAFAASDAAGTLAARFAAPAIAAEEGWILVP